MTKNTEISHLDWQGIKIEIRWAKGWGLGYSHLELESIAPERAPLPMTGTGYRSHFIDADSVECLGGPAAYVEAWLAEEAKNPAWVAGEATRRF